MGGLHATQAVSSQENENGSRTHWVCIESACRTLKMKMKMKMIMSRLKTEVTVSNNAYNGVNYSSETRNRKKI